MATQKLIDAALRADRLKEEERLVLQALKVSGYGKDGQPIGRVGALSANQLANVIYPLLFEPESNEAKLRQNLETCKRRVRMIVNALIIAHSIPICCEAGPGGGYYLPASDAEVETNHRTFHKRAMTGLIKATRARKAAYADAIVQLTLDFDGGAKALSESMGIVSNDDDAPPPWVGVVTKLLQQIQGNPEQYAAELHALQREFGDIFVPRHKVEKIRELTGELQKALEGLEKRAAEIGG